jgi:hypothetical protein
MPPSGGIVVCASGFSTAVVDAVRQSLWTSDIRHLSIKHLLRVAEILRSRAKFSTAIVERAR